MNQLAGCKTASIGEAISHESGIQMVKDYRRAYPDNATSHQIGINILRQILAQPGCKGIRFYNAVNEQGAVTLVYAGVDKQDKVIKGYVVIGDNGEMAKVPGIVGDRLRPGPRLNQEDELVWGLPE